MEKYAYHNRIARAHQRGAFMLAKFFSIESSVFWYSLMLHGISAVRQRKLLEIYHASFFLNLHHLTGELWRVHGKLGNVKKGLYSACYHVSGTDTSILVLLKSRTIMMTDEPHIPMSLPQLPPTAFDLPGRVMYDLPYWILLGCGKNEIFQQHIFIHFVNNCCCCCCFILFCFAFVFLLFVCLFFRGGGGGVHRSQRTLGQLCFFWITQIRQCYFTSTVIWHDDVIKWKHFPRYWPFARGIHRSPVKSPHKGQWRGALMFTLICVWINGCVNNR